MKVFLSWSGNESKQLATIFKEWLPNVLQYVEPYMSAQDISMGERWGNSIADNLEESVFGLIFVTPSNIKAPWINFEAGALSKTFESRVIPILYRAEVTILDQGPLKQFQSAKNLEKESIFSLLQSINMSNQDGGLNETRLENAFEMWWPKLKEAIDTIVQEETESIEEENGPTDRELLNVIYSKMVEQEKAKKQKQNVIQHSIVLPSGIYRDLERIQKILRECQTTLPADSNTMLIYHDLENVIDDLDNIVTYLKEKKHVKSI
ncbi:toll/interleukin-1 receptor domain-containing protein [Bacillus cereus]|nr:toll/interleukin-1 receptor domain-containing protein [Bacillus cereus]